MIYDRRRKAPHGLLPRLLLPLAFGLAAFGAQAQTDVPLVQDYHIEAGDLGRALDRLAEQNRLQIGYQPELVAGRSVPALVGNYSVRDALQRLLQGSGLEAEFVTDNAIVVRRIGESQSGAASRYTSIEEVIVTGQKREERIQDVPIAISAFSMDALDQQKIEGGFDLLKAVPNVTFSKSNFSGYNFQIRGIGTQAISATTDPGVAVSFNNTTLIVNRLFEQEYLDIERVEVLRGPQGTLYGRNATAGVINVISAKPVMGERFGELKLEAGNYNAQRMRGHINLPIDTEGKWAMRAAFAMTRRDGYGTNLAANDPETLDFVQRFNRPAIEQDIDNRDLWTGRFSLGWQPNDRFRANLVYERFEEDDRRMRSTKQLCHHDDGNVMLQALRPGPDGTYVLTPTRVDDAAGAERPPTEGPVSERALTTHFRGQLSQGCLPGSLYDRGNRRAGEHGAYGSPNGNSSPFVRAGRGSSFRATTWAPFDPDCQADNGFIVSNCQWDPMNVEGGQSRDLRSVYSLINPRYRAQSELIELSFDYELGEGLSISSQTLYMENELYSTQDFLRYKTLPMFSSTTGRPGTTEPDMAGWRRYAAPSGVVTDPQLGPSDRLMMQDLSQQYARQFGQEFRLSSSFSGPLNFSVGVNYTKFDTVTDYFVFINALAALIYAGDVYSGQPLAVRDLPSSTARADLLAAGYGLDDLTLFSWQTQGQLGMTLGCGRYFAEVDPHTGAGRCLHVQPGSIDDVAADPQGHNFFMSRNPYALDAASLFGELYYQLTPALKLTAGLRMNWDRKTFTPVPSQTMLADWRGRQENGLFGSYNGLVPEDEPIGPRCDPRITGAYSLYCGLGGSAPYGRGYPTQPDMVQEWREPTGRLGIDWMLDTGLAWVDETLLYAFYTRGYKAGGANPPLQSAPSGLLLAAAQAAAAPPTFKAEYVNAFEIGTKNRLLGGAVTLNAAAFYYDYTDYQISKILDRSANNENVDATVWGLELEAMFAPAENTLLNASIGYLRTRIADGEQSLDLMNRTQGGYQHYVDPSWASVPCTNEAGTAINVSHLACQRGQVGIDDNGDPIEGYLYRDGFDHWVIIRPTLTQASSCVAPAVLIYNRIAASSSMGADGLAHYCPAGPLVTARNVPDGYDPGTSAPNGSAGFFADIGGNELPNAPRFTVSLGAQHSYWIPGTDWSATGRVDWYWQDKSYGRMYNTGYDRLRDWTNTNVSFWITNDRLGLTIEAYVKNAFNETPITGAFLNSDDTGLSTNVFTLDPRLVGLSIRKMF